jgi:hypothetical protein
VSIKATSHFTYHDAATLRSCINNMNMSPTQDTPKDASLLLVSTHRYQHTTNQCTQVHLGRSNSAVSILVRVKGQHFVNSQGRLVDSAETVWAMVTGLVNSQGMHTRMGCVLLQDTH